MHVAGTDIAEEWPSLYRATTLKSYPIPGVSPATVYCVVVTRRGFAREYSEADDSFR